MIPIDVVLVGDVVRFCYSDSEDIALVAENNPLDKFWTRQVGQKVPEWILERRPEEVDPGFANKGQAQRCLDMIRDAKIEILEKP